MPSKIKIDELEYKKIIYAKYLLNNGCHYLDNTSDEVYFNISVILFANSLEILIYTTYYILFAEDISREPVSIVLGKIKKKHKTFPQSEFKKIFEARNNIYHNLDYRTYNSCNEMHEISLRCFKKICREYLKIDYNSISLVNLIKDNDIKIEMINAENYLNKKDIINAIKCSCIAFAKFEERLKKRGYWKVDLLISSIFSGTKISYERYYKKILDNVKETPHLRGFSDQIEEQVNKKFMKLFEQIDFFFMIGKFYEDYKYFLGLRPSYHIFMDGEVKFIEEKQKVAKYSLNDSRFIFDFVLKVILEIEPKLKPIDVKTISGEIIKIIP